MSNVVLHVCCAPCSITVVDALRLRGYNVYGVFFNPNIHPLQEYLRRRESMQKLAESVNLGMIWADEEYNLAEWLSMVADSQEYGERCTLCYRQRMIFTQNIAKERGIAYFSTSLLYSKRQLHERLVEVGTEISTEDTQFLYEDFRSLWQEGIDRSIEEEFYRQSYCGCVYSENERYIKKLNRLYT